MSRPPVYRPLPVSRPPPRVYRVGELNRKIADRLTRWGEVWVEGEISEATRAGSGHVYFTLTDPRAAAQLRCVMFSGDARRSRATLEADRRVRVHGGFDLYAPRGSFQLIVRTALPAGDGDRREQLERLKRKLADEGLFAVERKRPIPRLPGVVGLVTSRRGAALHDVVRVASARAPVRFVVSDCLVQGADAPRSIVMALRRIARLPGLDVVILTRGGGSVEDLWAFNDERVARAIAACPVPVVSGVGHEVDETVADLVADLRAATPSNAAELVVPDRRALERELDALRRRLERAMEVRIGGARLSIERLGGRLDDPRRALSRVRHRLQGLDAGLERAMGRRLGAERQRLDRLGRALAENDPRARLAQQRIRFEAIVARLERALAPALAEHGGQVDELTRRLERSLGPALDARRASLAHHGTRLEAARPPAAQLRARLGELAGRLDALSPLRVLARGYAIALKDGRALLEAGDAEVGDALRVRLSRGELEVEVSAVRDE